MNSLKTFFLRSSPWQIFFLMAGLYFADMFVGARLIGTERVPVNRIPPTTVLALQASVMLVLAVYLAWFWASGLFLHFLVQPALRLNFGLSRPERQRA